ncbi:MAG: Extracellular solute-binding protein [Deltaproteobacteria bacterium]|nr:Extracellular solute-binding protein [Deltaproteobacteria bacterium]
MPTVPLLAYQSSLTAIALCRSEYRNSLRIDIAKDALPVTHRLTEGVKYLDVTCPEYSDMAPIFKLAREIAKAKE